jgi:DNA repair exonuclease SbcCD ATPase subunit
MLVKLELEVDGMDLTIKRGRKPNKLEVLHNGEPYSRHSAGTIDETIEQIIGMDTNIFLNTVMLSSNVNPFMNLKPAAQRDFMEKLLSLDTLALRAKALKAMSKDNDVEIKLEEQNKDNFIQNLERTKRKIEDMERRHGQWITDHESKVEKLRNAFQKLSAIDVDTQLEISERNSEIIIKANDIKKEIDDLETQLKATISEIKTEHSAELNGILADENEGKDVFHTELTEKLDALTKEKEAEFETISEFKDELASISSTLTKKLGKLEGLMTETKKLEREKKSLDKGECPFCNQPYTSHDKIEEINEHLEDLENLQEELSKAAEELDEQHELRESEYKKRLKDHKAKYAAHEDEIRSEHTEALENFLADIRAEKNRIQHDTDVDIENARKEISVRRSALQKKYDDIMSKVEEVEHDRDDCNRIISDLRNTKERLEEAESEENPFTDQLEVLNDEIEDYDDSKMENLVKRQEHYKILIKLLTDSKSYIRKSLIDQYVPFINNAANGYLAELEASHMININNDLTVDLIYMNKSMSYGNLSNGERMRVNVAVSLAFRDLLDMSGRSFNLLAIDELLDNGLDGAGFFNVFKLLKNKTGKSVFIISHRDELIAEVDKVITVEKTKGFSHIL